MFKRIVFAGPIPPPVTGASIVTDRFLSRLRAAVVDDRWTIDVVGLERPVGTSTPATVFRRIAASVRLFAALARPVSCLYLSVPGGMSALAVLPGLLAARLQGTRVVMHHHSFAYLNRKSSVFSILFLLGGRDALHIVLCDKMGGLLQSGYGVSRTTVLSNLAFVPDKAFDETVMPPDNASTFTLGFYSNLTLEKGVGVAIDAAIGLVQSGLDYRLLLAGPTSTSDAEKVVLDAVASHEQIAWLGRLEQSDVPHYFDQVDLLLFPTKYVNEAQPMVVLEAAARGVPTLATSLGCLPELSSVRVVEPGADLSRQIVAYRQALGSRKELAAETRKEAARTALELDRLIGIILS